MRFKRRATLGPRRVADRGEAQELIGRDLEGEGELELPTLPKRLPRAVLSQSEMERVLMEPDLTTPLGLRDRAILEMLYSTGIRRMELVGQDCMDLDAERGTLLVREGNCRRRTRSPRPAREG